MADEEIMNIQISEKDLDLLNMVINGIKVDGEYCGSLCNFKMNKYGNNNKYKVNCTLFTSLLLYSLEFNRDFFLRCPECLTYKPIPQKKLCSECGHELKDGE